MRRHLTYANVVSTLCLVLLLSGSAYAAGKISGKQLKNGTVTGKKLKDGAVTSADVGDGSLSGGDVADGSLGPADVAGLGLDDLSSGLLPGARMERPSGTVPAGATTVFDMTAEGFDTGGMYTPGDDVITVRRSGTYVLVGYVAWGDAGGTQRQVQLRVDGATRQVAVDHSTPNEFTQQLVTVQPLTAGQTVSLFTLNGDPTPASLSGFTGQAPVSVTVQMVSP